MTKKWPELFVLINDGKTEKHKGLNGREERDHQAKVVADTHDGPILAERHLHDT